MPRLFKKEKIVEIPDNVEITVDKTVVVVKGPRGELKRDFDKMPIFFDFVSDKELKVFTMFGKSKDNAMVGTVAGHIKNMIKGVTEGFTYKIKVVTSHFPATVKYNKKENRIEIHNLYGRKDPIRIPIPPDYDVNINIQDRDVEISGNDIEHVSQLAHRIAESTRLRGKRAKDPTVFMDGLYVYEKH